MQEVEELAQTRGQDPASFFRELYPALYRWVSIETGAPPSDVEDLVQETLASAWSERGNFKGDSAPLTWVIGIAKYKVRDRWRRAERGRQAACVLQALGQLETDLLPEGLVRTDELRSRVRQALQTLGAENTDLLIRRYVLGQSVRALADGLGLSEKAAESRLHRAREAFRRDLLTGGLDDDE